jgi:Amt family ammonium transporter
MKFRFAALAAILTFTAFARAQESTPSEKTPPNAAGDGTFARVQESTPPERTNPALTRFIERSDENQNRLLEQSSEILRQLGMMAKSVTPATEPKAAPSPSTAALEERLARLEHAAAASPTPAPAEDAVATVQKNVDATWMVITAALVFFMQAGFCMVELGFTRSKNAINICMKNFLDFSVGGICFLFVGFPLMFGLTFYGLWGTGPFWLSSIPGDSAFWSFWFFQVVFSGTAATIISGAMAERTKFTGYLVFTIVMTSLIYPFIGHWAWGSFGGAFNYGGGKGWLEAMGYADFAGSSVVHGIGGAASLAGILVLGPRLGRFRADGTANLIAGHNLPLATLGVFILWFGWYGFNPGSTLVGDTHTGRIAVNTTIAPCAGAIAAMFAMWLHQGRPDLGITLNGALGGLVGITANCNCVTPASAVVIGLMAGVIATFGSLLLERLRIDDAVGAVPVHLFCGWWGILSVALFNEEGFSPHRLGVQALGGICITGVAFVLAFVTFKIINAIVGLRATDEEQDLGLDFTEHSGNAYPGFVTSEE